METIKKILNSLNPLIWLGVNDNKKSPHKHKWEYKHRDSTGGDRYTCKTCGSEGARHPYHHMDMKVLVWSKKARQLPHEHEWCFEYNAGRKVGVDKNTPMSTVVSCGCGKWAVKHYGETEYNLLTDIKN